MRSVIVTLCLALLAGAALAALNPPTRQAKKVEVQPPLEFPTVPFPGLVDQSQGATCTGLPDLGDCSQFPWGQPGVTCDCDVPIPYATCTFEIAEDTFILPVTKCYGVNFCGVIFDPCT